MEMRVGMRMSVVQEVFEVRAGQPEAVALEVLWQARECKEQQSESHRIVPRDTPLEGTVKSLAKSFGPVQHEVSQTAFSTTPPELPLGPRHACSLGTAVCRTPFSRTRSKY